MRGGILCCSSAQRAVAGDGPDSSMVASVCKDCCVGITRNKSDSASILEDIRVIGVLEGREYAGDWKIIYRNAVVVDDC